MPKNFRVIVWGPGEVGAAAIAGVLADDGLELVGAALTTPTCGLRIGLSGVPRRRG